MWESTGCRSHLAAAASLTQRCSEVQEALQRRWHLLGHLSVRGKRAITTVQWHCTGSVWLGTGCKAVLLLRTAPAFGITAIPGGCRTHHFPLLSRGTGWLREGWRALTRVPRPLHTTRAALQSVQKIWAHGSVLSHAKKISWRLYFPMYCSCHQDVLRLKTAV